MAQAPEVYRIHFRIFLLPVVNIRQSARDKLVAFQGSTPFRGEEEPCADLLAGAAMGDAVGLLSAVKVKLVETEQLQGNDHRGRRKDRVKAEVLVGPKTRVETSHFANLPFFHRQHGLVDGCAVTPRGRLERELPFLQKHSAASVLTCLHAHLHVQALRRALVTLALPRHFLHRTPVLFERHVLEGHDAKELDVVLHNGARWYP
mmetsp:Transcript_56369/g.157055  ORF Transcript_56369/g.157055 Transcript_56369/m.157055 type:complete len:204 (-) Transcript_56369:153-764(-)